MPWFLDLLMQGNLSEGWTAQDGSASRTWKVCDCMEGGDQFLEGLCNR